LTRHRSVPVATMREWLPGDHLVWFCWSWCSSWTGRCCMPGTRMSGAGRAAYDPDMLIALLIYAYCQGVCQIQQRCATDVAFRVLCAQDAPDYTTIARFRADHKDAFAALFPQVLQVAAAAGLARFGTSRSTVRRSPRTPRWMPTAPTSGWPGKWTRCWPRRHGSMPPKTPTALAGPRTMEVSGCRRVWVRGSDAPSGSARRSRRCRPRPGSSSKRSRSVRRVLLGGWNAPRPASRSLGAFPEARTGWPRPEHIWPGRSPVNRQARSPGGCDRRGTNGRGDGPRSRSSSIPTWCEPARPPTRRWPNRWQHPPRPPMTQHPPQR
jgi:hypothetical protein